MKRKRFFSFVLCILFTVSALMTGALAATATASVGTSTHQGTYAEPAHFRINAAVTYSELYGDKMTIYNMHSMIWNYETSGVTLKSPFFAVETPEVLQTTTLSFNHNALEIPADSSSYYFSINWQEFLNSFYNGAEGRYDVPENVNDTSAALLTKIGVYTGSYYDEMSLPYSYVSYWYGNGYLETHNLVSNTPSWSSAYVTTIEREDSGASPLQVSYTVNSEESRLPTKNNGNNLSFALSVDSQNSLFFTDMPTIATDPTFKNVLNLADDDVIVENNTMHINVACADKINSIFVKMPSVVAIDKATEVLVNSTSSLQTEEIYDEDNDIRVLKVSYDRNDFPIVPNSAVLIVGEEIEAVSAHAYYDDNGIAGGYFFFVMPDEITLPADYSLRLVGELVSIEGDVYEVSVR